MLILIFLCFLKSFDAMELLMAAALQKHLVLRETVIVILMMIVMELWFVVPIIVLTLDQKLIVACSHSKGK